MDVLFGDPKPPKVTPTPPVDPALPSDADIAKLPQHQQVNVKNMRELIKSLNHDLVEARKNPGGQDSVALKAELDALKAERDRVSEELERVSLERSPRFQMKYDGAKANVLAQVKDYLAQSGVEDAKVQEIAAKAMTMNIKDRITFLQAEAPDVAAALYPLYSQIDGIEKQRVGELAKARDARQRDDQTAQERAKQFRDQHMTTAINAVREAGHGLLKEIDGNDAWNAGVKALKATIQEVFTSEDPEVQSRAITMGVLAPQYLAMLKKEHAKNKFLEGELRKYTKAMPRVNGSEPAGGSSDPRPASLTPEQAGQRAAERAAARLANIG
jgi:hypothetical protein